MRIGIGIDGRLGLGVTRLRDLAEPARALGYDEIWTNAGPAYDPVALCVAWHASAGLATGVSVVPIAQAPAATLALEARTADELTGGTFTLGLGSGTITRGSIPAVRAYVADLRRTAPDVPIAVGALGPRMLRLAGEVAQSAALNWCTPAQIAWSRAQAGAAVMLVAYVRVCVDDDAAAARRALARQLLGYALPPGPPRDGGYPAHFQRMGFADELAYLAARRDAGAGDEELAALVPERLLAAAGYAGRGDGAREWLATMSAGLDVAIVRIVTPRPGDPRPVRAAMEAFAPAR